LVVAQGVGEQISRFGGHRKMKDRHIRSARLLRTSGYSGGLAWNSSNKKGTVPKNRGRLVSFKRIFANGRGSRGENFYAWRKEAEKGKNIKKDRLRKGGQSGGEEQDQTKAKESSGKS